MSGYRALFLTAPILALAAAGCKDTQKPAWPKAAALEAGEVTGTAMALSWPAATDNNQIRSYRILGQRAASQGKTDLPGKPRVIGKVGGKKTTFSAEGLTEAAEYTFKVTAVDPAGNVSQPLVLTAATRDVSGPQWNDGARMTFTRADAEGKTTLTFSWPVATDNVALTRLRLKMRDQVIKLKGDARGHTLTTNNPGGRWLLEAADAAGNWSQHPLNVLVSARAPMDQAAMKAQAAARRTRLTRMVARMGILKLLGTRGSGSSLGHPPANLLSGSMDSDRAFRGIGGLTVAGRGGGMRGGSGGGGTGVAAGIGGSGSGGMRGNTGPRVRLTPGPVEVSRYLRLKLGRVKRCYTKALQKNSGLSGSITVTLAADAAGKVSASSVTGVPDARLLACVKSAVEGRGKPGLSGTVTLKLDPGKTSK